jgi:hypothetical protein
VKKSLFNAFQVVSNSYTGSDLVSGLSEMHQLHQRARNSRGRVGHKRANRPKVKYSTFQTYMQKVMDKVGMAKGGFADKSGQLDNGRIPVWVKRHSGEGTATRKEKHHVAEWKFANDKSYTKDGYVMGASNLDKVLKGQQKFLKKSLEGKLRRMGKL